MKYPQRKRKYPSSAATLKNADYTINIIGSQNLKNEFDKTIKTYENKSKLI